jgi:SAM-dependent methyltransferase
MSKQKEEIANNKKLYGLDYYKRYSNIDLMPRMLNILKKIQFAKNDIVLDAGCGSGVLAELTNKKVSKYYGVNFSTEMIRSAKINQQKLKIKNAEFICGDLNKFCLKHKNSFDKVFAMDFSEHLDDEDFIQIFSSLHYSLKPKGSVFIHTPNGKYILEVFKKAGIIKGAPEHIGIRDNTEHIRLLKKVGFSKIRVIFLPHYINLLSIFDFLKYIPFLGKFFQARLFIICEK